MIEQLLPTFEPSPNDLTSMAMRQPLAYKIEIAIKLLQSWQSKAFEMNVAGYWLAFSGGKDSTVIYDLAKRAGVAFHPAYSVTTIDPPELVRHIKRHYPDVEFVRQPQSMMARLGVRSLGPPTRLARWCCQEYKEQGGRGWVKVIGVRAAESPRRAATWKTVVPNRKSGMIVCPILYWTDKDVWAYHKLRDLPYCELYDQGFNRLGCVGCPMAGPAKVAEEFARWPGIARNWERAVKAFWERWHDVPRNDGAARYTAGFANAEEFWQWWLSGARKNSAGKGCQMEFIFT